MNIRTNKFLCMVLIPVAVCAAMSGMYQEGLYRRVSHMLLLTPSMEAAANGGAIGVDLPAP